MKRGNNVLSTEKIQSLSNGDSNNSLINNNISETGCSRSHPAAAGSLIFKLTHDCITAILNVLFYCSSLSEKDKITNKRR